MFHQASTIILLVKLHDEGFMSIRQIVKVKI